jgi:hypothetical protein
MLVNGTIPFKLGRALAAIALAAACCASKAAAQIAPGYSGSSTTAYMDGDEYWRTLRSFGVCFAKESQAKALALLATEPDSKAEREVYKQAIGGKGNQPCLSSTSMHVRLGLTRGAIAEGLYKRGVAVPPELIQQAPPAGAVPPTLSGAVRCYVAAHRAKAEALLSGTLSGSKKEFAALQAMAPDFYACLPAKAQKMRFNPTQIRFRLAEALLRMPAAATAQPAAQER